MAFDLNGIPLGPGTRLVIPQRGALEAEIVFANDDEPDERDPGLDVLSIEGATFTGTFAGGVNAGDRRGRFVAGAAGWSSEVTSRAYANDAGVTASSIIGDAATLVGETLDTAGLNGVRVGVNYARQVGAASETLARVFPNWRVDRDGVTRFGDRESELADADNYRVLEFDSRTRIAMLDVDDLSLIDVGSQIVVEDETLTIRTLIISVDEKIAIEAYCGGDTSSESDFADVFRSVVKAVTNDKLFGTYRYRIAAMSGKRADAQPVNASIGLPLLQNVEIWTAPGISSSELTPGVHCALQFLDGDASQPVITAVGGAFQDGHEPASLDVGGDNGVEACGVGSLGTVFMPAVVPVSGTVSGAPFVGVMTITSAVTCVMQTGSKRVRIKL